MAGGAIKLSSGRIPATAGEAIKLSSGRIPATAGGAIKLYSVGYQPWQVKP